MERIKYKIMRPYQLAKLKKVSTQTIYRWIREGIISADKIKKIIVKNKRIDIEESVINNELKYYPKIRK